MCIIFASFNNMASAIPTLDELKQAEALNRHGGGMAWLDGDRVRFERNISADRAYAILASLPVFVPFIIHFRIASQGSIMPSLCHPFSLDAGANNDALNGEATAVLAHNGTIDRDHWLPMLLRSDLAILPGGDWSDTRALAYTIAASGNRNVLDLFASFNRFVVLDASGLDLRGSWIKLRDGIYTSCHLHKPTTTVAQAPATGKAKQIGIGLTNWRPKHGASGDAATIDDLWSDMRDRYDLSDDGDDCKAWYEHDDVSIVDMLDDDDYFAVLDLARDLHGENVTEEQMEAVAAQFTIKGR